MKISRDTDLTERETEVINAVKSHNHIRIKDLAKKLEMWDSNLRKMIVKLEEKGYLHKYVQDNFTCVKLKK